MKKNRLTLFLRPMNSFLSSSLGRRFRHVKEFPFLILDTRRFLTVRIDVINRCNLRCKMCHYSLEEFRNAPLSSMSYDLFHKIANEIFPHTQHLIFSAGAEPLMSKEYPRMIEIVKRYHLPYVSFFTNGNLLNETLARQFVKLKVNEIHFSVDGASKSTYESIRVGANFERLVANIKRLQDLKHAQNAHLPRLSFQFVMMRSNIDELPEYIEFAHILDIENINVSLLIPHEGLHLDHEILEPGSERLIYALSKARNIAEKYNIHFGFPAHLLEKSPDEPLLSKERRCTAPWTEIFIRPDGKVHPCCFWGDPPLGDLSTQNFIDIWHGSEYEQLRQELSSGNLRATCVRCPIFGVSKERKVNEGTS